MNRRGFFASLALMGLAAPALAALPRPGVDEALPPAPDGDVHEAQYRGRGRRCRWETRQVRFRDRWGRVRWRTVRREVCW